MRTLAALLLLLPCLSALAQGMGAPVAVDTWMSKKNQKRLILAWEGVPAYKERKLPDGSTEPPRAPWPFLLYIVEADSKASQKIDAKILKDTRFRYAAHAVKPIRVTPEQAIDLKFLAKVSGIKDPTLIVFRRDFTVVDKLFKVKELTANKLLPLMAKAADEAYQVKLATYVRENIDLLKEAEKLWKTEQKIESLTTRAGSQDKAKQKKVFKEVEELEKELLFAEDNLLDTEDRLRGSLILKPDEEEAIPATVGSGKGKRELTPEEIETIKAYREFARSDNPVVRAAAVEDLGSVDSGVIAEIALKAANDVDPRVTRAAGVALGRMKSQEALEVMYAALKSSKAKPRIAALFGFADGGHDYRPAAPELVAVYRKGTDETRRAAIQAMAAQSDPIVVPPLVDALDDSVAALRVLAAGVLGQRAQKEAVQPLLAKLESKDWSMQKAAVDALARIRAKESIGPLIDRFQVEEGLLKEALYNALVSITGQDFRYRTESWKRWWDKYGSSFTVPTEEEIRVAREKARQALKGYAKPDKRKYHQIETLSRKMVFVIDVSSSMSDKITIPPSAPQKVRDEFPSRVKMEIAKREMIALLATLDANVYFNIITFAGKVKPWKDSLVPGTQRTSAIKYVEKLQPIESKTRGGGGRSGRGGRGGGSGKGGGGIAQKTNTYGALMAAFGLSDQAVPNWRARSQADTIFMVTDGVPTIGKIVEVPKLIATITEMNRTRGVVIHVITFDKQAGIKLRPLAEGNGGQLVVRGYDPDAGG
jgi:HEAT repeat protein